MAGGLDIDTSRIGQIDGLTLADALRSLKQAAGQPVALIIDEAQLMLVMSGSDQDKLSRLVVGAGTPFCGSQIQALPPLDAGTLTNQVV